MGRGDLKRLGGECSAAAVCIRPRTTLRRLPAWRSISSTCTAPSHFAGSLTGTAESALAGEGVVGVGRVRSGRRFKSWQGTGGWYEPERLGKIPVRGVRYDCPNSSCRPSYISHQSGKNPGPSTTPGHAHTGPPSVVSPSSHRGCSLSPEPRTRPPTALKIVVPNRDAANAATERQSGVDPRGGPVFGIIGSVGEVADKRAAMYDQMVQDALPGLPFLWAAVWLHVSQPFRWRPSPGDGLTSGDG